MSDFTITPTIVAEPVASNGNGNGHKTADRDALIARYRELQALKSQATQTTLVEAPVEVAPMGPALDKNRPRPERERNHREVRATAKEVTPRITLINGEPVEVVGSRRYRLLEAQHERFTAQRARPYQVGRNANEHRDATHRKVPVAQRAKFARAMATHTPERYEVCHHAPAFVGKTSRLKGWKPAELSTLPVVDRAHSKADRGDFWSCANPDCNFVSYDGIHWVPKDKTEEQIRGLVREALADEAVEAVDIRHPHFVKVDETTGVAELVWKGNTVYGPCVQKSKRCRHVTPDGMTWIPEGRKARRFAPPAAYRRDQQYEVPQSRRPVRFPLVDTGASPDATMDLELYPDRGWEYGLDTVAGLPSVYSSDFGLVPLSYLEFVTAPYGEVTALENIWPTMDMFYDIVDNGEFLPEVLVYRAWDILTDILASWSCFVALERDETARLDQILTLWDLAEEVHQNADICGNHLQLASEMVELVLYRWADYLARTDTVSRNTLMAFIAQIIAVFNGDTSVPGLVPAAQHLASALFKHDSLKALIRTERTAVMPLIAAVSAHKTEPQYAPLWRETLLFAKQIAEA